MTYHIENWKPVVGYEGWYEVSDLGAVRRIRAGTNSVPFRKLRSNSITAIYKSVSLCVNNKRYTRAIHKLVAESFLAEIPGKNEINHIDGDKHNNRLDNLERVSSSENSLHAIKIGKQKIGEEMSCSVLTESKVREIRLRLKAGERASSLAKEHKINPTYIYQVKHRKTWKHVV